MQLMRVRRTPIIIKIFGNLTRSNNQPIKGDPIMVPIKIKLTMKEASNEFNDLLYDKYSRPYSAPKSIKGALINAMKIAAISFCGFLMADNKLKFSKRCVRGSLMLVFNMKNIRIPIKICMKAALLKPTCFSSQTYGNCAHNAPKNAIVKMALITKPCLSLEICKAAILKQLINAKACAMPAAKRSLIAK